MRDAAKRLAHLLALAATAPFWGSVVLTGSDTLFAGMGQALSLIPGKTGSYLRAAYLSRTLSRACQDCFIGFGSYFSHRQASVGPGVYVGAYCIIGMAGLEPHATIASRVSILSGARQHGFEDTSRPVQEQGGVFSRVLIGTGAWIGEGSVVMANVGERSVVGAGSVVTRAVEDRTVAAGNPARTLRSLEEHS